MSVDRGRLFPESMNCHNLPDLKDLKDKTIDYFPGFYLPRILYPRASQPLPDSILAVRKKTRKLNLQHYSQEQFMFVVVALGKAWRLGR